MINRPIGLSSIQDFVRWGASRFAEAGLFYGHGLDNPVDEATELVRFALHLPAGSLVDFRDARLTREERDRIVGLFARRIEERLPVAYLTQSAGFAGLDFFVTEDVLIPRSPIAELVEAGFAPWVDPERVTRVLDLGTGSGCIGIAAAIFLPSATVDLVDLDPAALRVAAANVDRYGLADRVTLLESDLFSALAGRAYDVIVSNPPYVSSAELDALPAEYFSEPRHALAGGASGLDLVLDILRRAGEHLRDQGVLIVEVGSSSEALIEWHPDLPFLWLDFERGGDGVFLLTKAQLDHHAQRLAEGSGLR